MSKGKIEIIETCCRRCGKSIRTLSHTIIGADDAREKFGSICGGCITPEEDNELTEMLLALMQHENKQLVDKTDIPSFFEGKQIEILITMGAGDIDTLVEPIENYLKNK